ncbi:MAG: hypothetical protein A2X09_00010 [Bacteroidetes bacterium GWF2_43_11]|nr:MAG: hypothetical protein A2X09_00010 [Bacteroidetes bacterium GWF2_43_11]
MKKVSGCTIVEQAIEAVLKRQPLHLSDLKKNQDGHHKSIAPNTPTSSDHPKPNPCNCLMPF